MPATLFLLFGALLPFLVQTVVLLSGVTGYVFQSFYKAAQLGAFTIWRFAHGERGLAIFWPVREQLPSRRTFLTATFIGLLVGAVAIALLLTLLPFVDLDRDAIRYLFDERFKITPLSGLLITLYLCTINSALEEMHFRQWMDLEISRRFGTAVGITFAAVAFGMMHVFLFIGFGVIPLLPIGIMAAGLAVTGALWSILIRQKGGIYAAWWSHAVADAVLLFWGLQWLGYL